MKRELLIVDDLLVDRAEESMDALRGVVDWCHAIESEGRNKVPGLDGTEHVATFPAIIVEQYCNDNGITLHEWMNNPVHVDRMLNDPALRGFRTSRKRVGQARE